MKTTLHILIAFILAGALWAQTLPVAKTGQTVSYAAGDDGDLQRGRESQEPRFIDHGDGTVTDKLTGLMWVKAPHELDGTSGYMAWASALTFCNDLEFAGYDDWVLPNRKELMSLVDYSNYNPALPSGHPFIGLQSSYDNTWWSSSTFADRNNSAWTVSLYGGLLGGSSKKYKYEYPYVWPVRSGQ